MADIAGEALEMHSLDVTRPGVLPFAIGSFDTIGPLARADFPHRHSFYEIGLVTHGSGAHVVDLVRQDLDPPCLYALVPGQVHQWQDARDVAGWVLLFNEDFLLTHHGDAEIIRTLSARPRLRPNRTETAGLRLLLRELDREHRSAAAGHISILSSYLHILLLCWLRMTDRETASDEAKRARSRADELTHGFRRLMAQLDPGLRSVEACARELGVSTSYLHDVVKRGTGRTPGQLIRAKQILEAKRLIAGTDLTIGQVASAVGFGDPAYFCRFFRRETGVSPGQFRRAVGEKHHDHAEPSLGSTGWPA
ncbi:AraC family transcriptional regulator [Streptomyces montanisoli]|uniref:Helix-turn-helix domain-containing protein n=1 Tax=Streptomyces montanisoli TaxID=2798581 RepID=A0A940M4G7_9ACTN|nr:AraC family transcriptional regulator [Streptomyces montanisoli]MBP0455940.1 helix-turn-helix domain-containing protein [Streptomyces montanisoli]